MEPQPPSGPRPSLINEDSLSHSDTPQSVELLWTSDQLVAGTSNLTTHNTQVTDIYAPPGGIQTQNPSNRAAADPRLRPRGHWDRRNYIPV